VSTCAFDTGFDSGFEICTAVEPTETVVTLAGVPGLVRRRPRLVEASGVGYVSVIAAGRLAAEHAISASVLIDTFGYGFLMAVAVLRARAQIAFDAAATMAAEVCLASVQGIASAGMAVLAAETAISGRGAVLTNSYARLRPDGLLSGRLSMRSGGEAHLDFDDDELVILMAAAAMMLLED